MAGKWQGWDLNPDSLTQETPLATTIPHRLLPTTVELYLLQELEGHGEGGQRPS